MNDMTNKDMAIHHKAQAAAYHKRAQAARKEALACRDRRDFLGKLKADCRASEYRRTRNQHQAQAKHYAALA